jgi:hypothetical protein
LQADIRLLAAHLHRVSAASAELMRGLQYLGSGEEEERSEREGRGTM